MKSKKKIALVFLLVMVSLCLFIISGCTEKVVSKTAHTEAITEANTNKATAIISADGSDVLPSDKWVTEEVMTNYTNAIAKAQIVAGNADATEDEVTASAEELAKATKAFNDAKADGTKADASIYAALSGLTVDGTAIVGFHSTTENYSVPLVYATTATPLVEFTKSYDDSSVVVTPATDVSSATVANRTTTIVVTAADGVTTKTYTITFVISPESINLGAAENYVILSKSGVSTTTLTSIVGDIGISPVASTYITGFGLTLDGSGMFYTSSLVTGKIYAATNTAPTPSNLTTAVNDMITAYNDAAGRTIDYSELHSGDLSGKTLTSGVYKWGTDVLINTELTLNGGEKDVWIFQIAGKLTQASDVKIILTGGAQAENIFWQVADTVTIGTGAHFEGNILAKTNIAVLTNASVNGKMFAQTAVTLDANQIVDPLK